MLVHVHHRLNVGLSCVGGHSHVVIGGGRFLQVAHNVHLLRNKISHTHPDGKSSLDLLHVCLSLLLGACLLQQVTQHEHIGLSVVRARLQRRSVVGHPHLLRDTNTLVTHTGDNPHHAGEHHRGEGSLLLRRLGVRAVHRQDGVVTERSGAKVQSTDLSELAIGGGIAPGTVSSAGHADELGQHVHALHHGGHLVNITVLACLGESNTHSLANSFHLLHNVGWHVLLLSLVHPLQGRVDGSRGSNCPLYLNHMQDLLQRLGVLVEVQVKYCTHVVLVQFISSELHNLLVHQSPECLSTLRGSTHQIKAESIDTVGVSVCARKGGSDLADTTGAVAVVPLGHRSQDGRWLRVLVLELGMAHDRQRRHGHVFQKRKHFRLPT
mmetsp:Transcript_3622/g.6202  ORF Transcript_3622/g.6202 Transcript_3622/m.6202 type:complete len:380 (-) Transcript_3622:24-1163(-)